MNTKILGIPMWVIGVGIAAYFIFRKKGLKKAAAIPIIVTPSQQMSPIPGTEYQQYEW